MIPKSNVLMSLFQKQTSFSSQMNKIVSYKQIGKAIEFALGNFVENKFCGKEFEEYEYREDNIVRHSFRNKTILANTVGLRSDHFKENPINSCKNPEIELFIFCLLIGRDKMSEFFWSESKVYFMQIFGFKVFY